MSGAAAADLAGAGKGMACPETCEREGFPSGICLFPSCNSFQIPVDDRLVLLGLLDELVEGLQVVVDVVGALEEVVAVNGVRVLGRGCVGVSRGEVVLVGDGRPLGRAGRVTRVGVLQLLELEAMVKIYFTKPRANHYSLPCRS